MGNLCYGRKFAFKFTFILTLNLVTSLYRLYNKGRVMLFFKEDNFLIHTPILVLYDLFLSENKMVV